MSDIPNQLQDQEQVCSRDAPQGEPLFTAISQTNSDFQLAYERAAATLPKFIEHIERGGDTFRSVKLRFRDSDESERLGEDRFLFLWLGSVHYYPDDREFSGVFFEFLNRIDEIVIFDRLDATQLDSIVKIQLQRVIDRLAKQNIHLTVTDDTTRYLADAGFDPVFGARPLKRAIQKHLLDPLSLAVLEGGFKEGDHITAEMKSGKPVFEKK